MTRTALAGAAALLTTAALAQPLALPKTGSCPAGYRESGGFCAPTRDPVLATACPYFAGCTIGLPFSTTNTLSVLAG